ncbi:hypothetical protein NMG46_21680 [Mesorhizobium sp. LMG 17147]|uniref:hypothetical protein n=1 Tax=Mesorhizobium sp. LMG 17147 TaxID=2963091 RepID=UPI0020C9971E|nr:hypothetical protein [Mesorhizobium sp. LMG 17147]MCP9232833.1 hypothetical protein [Mesorhizobium sp. LMG 17147]
MKLLQSGVDLLTIQAWLGHAQVATTHRCAAADVEMMRNGLEGGTPNRFYASGEILWRSRPHASRGLAQIWHPPPHNF